MEVVLREFTLDTDKGGGRRLSGVSLWSMVYKEEVFALLDWLWANCLERSWVSKVQWHLGVGCSL